jgi:hypothetical protein
MGRVNTSLELCRPNQILVPLRCVEHANCTCRIAYRDRVLGVPNNLAEQAELKAIVNSTYGEIVVSKS